ncbi:MAG: N-acetyltransferase [Spirochaetaceae bacterium]|nr:N-acetyltransferase [Spirochaetaceae bacterium]
MNKLSIRLMKITDAPTILSIYKPYIEETSITFECTTPTLKDFTQRIKNISSFYPYLVYEFNNKVIGYAYAGKIREREAYQWDAELSIYLDNQYLHKGIGKILYMALLDILKLQNIYNVYGVITQPNERSVKLHEDLGFNKLGVFHNTGYKFNSWHDVIWLEKKINDFIIPPKPLKAIGEIDEKGLTEILSKYNAKLGSFTL